MSTNTSKWRHFVNFLAYCAVVMVGVALLIALILNKVGASSSISGALTLVANCLAYIIISISAFYYCRSKRNVWFFVVWIVAVVLIFVCIIL